MGCNQSTYLDNNWELNDIKKKKWDKNNIKKESHNEERIRIYLFYDFWHVTGYDVILSDESRDIVYFTNISSDGKKICGINKCLKVIEIGKFAKFEYDGRNTRLINEIMEEEILIKLRSGNVKIIGTQFGTTLHLFCSICGLRRDHQELKMTINGCVICMNCGNNYENILGKCSDLFLKSENFVYLDTKMRFVSVDENKTE